MADTLEQACQKTIGQLMMQVIKSQVAIQALNEENQKLKQQIADRGNESQQPKPSVE